MAAKAERIKVEVSDSSEGQTRTFIITLTASNSDFELTDLLRQRGVISPVNSDLKHAVRLAIETYLLGAEALIATLTQSPSAVSQAIAHGKRNSSKHRSNRTSSRQSAPGNSQVNQLPNGSD